MLSGLLRKKASNNVEALSRCAGLSRYQPQSAARNALATVNLRHKTPEIRGLQLRLIHQYPRAGTNKEPVNPTIEPMSTPQKSASNNAVAGNIWRASIRLAKSLGSVPKTTFHPFGTTNKKITNTPTEKYGQRPSMLKCFFRLRTPPTSNIAQKQVEANCPNKSIPSEISENIATPSIYCLSRDNNKLTRCVMAIRHKQNTQFLCGAIRLQRCQSQKVGPGTYPFLQQVVSDVGDTSCRTTFHKPKAVSSGDLDFVRENHFAARTIVASPDTEDYRHSGVGVASRRFNTGAQHAEQVTGMDRRGADNRSIQIVCGSDQALRRGRIRRGIVKLRAESYWIHIFTY